MTEHRPAREPPVSPIYTITTATNQASRSSKAALQRQLEDQYTVHWHRSTNMGGSRQRQIEMTENLPHWCEALGVGGESYSLSHWKAKLTEGSYCRSQSCSHAFEHLSLQHLWSTMHRKDSPITTHTRSHRTIVWDQSSYDVPTGDSITATKHSAPAICVTAWLRLN